MSCDLKIDGEVTNEEEDKSSESSCRILESVSYSSRYLVSFVCMWHNFKENTEKVTLCWIQVVRFVSASHGELTDEVELRDVVGSRWRRMNTKEGRTRRTQSKAALRWFPLGDANESTAEIFNLTVLWMAASHDLVDFSPKFVHLSLLRVWIIQVGWGWALGPTFLLFDSLYLHPPYPVIHWYKVTGLYYEAHTFLSSPHFVGPSFSPLGISYQD